MTDMDTTGRTVVGLFRDRAKAEAAIRELRTSGFDEDRIGLAMQQPDRDASARGTGTEAAEGAARGVVSGGLVGGLIGLLGSLLIPGVGPVVAGGVLASVLAGAGLGAATGGIVGALVGIGLPEEDARHFDAGLRAGGLLVTVDAGARTGEALAILQRHEVDLGPGAAGRYGPVDWSVRDNSVAATTPGATRIGGERRRARVFSYSGPERRVLGV
jgi:hypothetical protein